MNIQLDENALLSTTGRGRIMIAWQKYLTYGGFPEAIDYMNPRQYAESVYQKILLGDIA